MDQLLALGYHLEYGKVHYVVTKAASLTARNLDDVQDDEAACPAQVGQISMKLTSSLEYAK